MNTIPKYPGGYFVVAGIGALVITLLTVSYHALKHR